MGATGSQRRLVAFLGSLLVAGSVGALAASAAPPDPAAPALTPELADQIRALMAEKAARTPAQRKISSRLLYAERSRRGLALPLAVLGSQCNRRVEAGHCRGGHNGFANVDIWRRDRVQQT